MLAGPWVRQVPSLGYTEASPGESTCSSLHPTERHREGGAEGAPREDLEICLSVLCTQALCGLGGGALSAFGPLLIRVTEAIALKLKRVLSPFPRRFVLPCAQMMQTFLDENRVTPASCPT